MNSEMKRVVITGMGVISPVGNDVNTFWESLKAGKCGISRLEGFEEYNLPIHVAGRVKDFDPIQSGLSAAEKRRNDIYSQYALAAAAQAMAESGLVSNENIDENRFGIYFGSGIGGIQTFVTQTKILFDEGADRISPLFIPMMIPNIAGGNIAIKYKAKGPCLTHVSACATGTNSIGEATAAKMKEFRLVIWGMHGIYGAGKTLDETFGLIETVEKAAQIYMLTAHLPRVNTIRDSEMQQLAEFFGVNYRKDFLDL